MVFTGDKNAVRTRSSPLAAQRCCLQARVVRLEMIPISFVLAVSVLAIVHSIPLISDTLPGLKPHSFSE